MTTVSLVRRLLVDVRAVDHPTARDRGIGRYTAGLIGGLVGIGAPITGLFATDREAELIGGLAPGLELQRWSPAAIRKHTAPGTWYLSTQLMLHPITLDPVPSVVTRSGLPVAAVVYDVIPYRHPDRYLREPNALRQAQLRAMLARTLDAMVSISAFSADTAAEELQFPRSRIRVIGAGAESHFAPTSAEAVAFPGRVLPHAMGDYVVSVTGGDERKNTEGLLRAWSELAPAIRATHRLVIVAAVSARSLARWQCVAAEVGISDEVVFTGGVTDAEMVAILQQARLAVMPSIEEGFGLPVLEAAACGCPVICSGGTSLVEVLDEPAAWFDPSRPASIAAAIERALIDDDHRTVLDAAAQRAAERFTWERTADATVQALGELGPRWTRVLRRGPRRVAVAAPIESSPSAAGRHAAALVSSLRRSSPATVVDEHVDSSDTVEPARPDGEHRLALDVVGRYVKPWNWDDIVAVLDDAGDLVAAAELACRTPCHVWLLDLASVDEPDVATLAATLAGARSVIVSSGDAAEIVRGMRSDGPPVLVLPPPGTPLAAPPESSGSAGSWTFDDIAEALLRWLEDVDGLRSGTIREASHLGT